MLAGKIPTALYYADIVDGKTELSARYMYVFKFIEGYCIIAAMPEAEAVFMRDASIYTSVFMQVLIFAVLFVFIYFPNRGKSVLTIQAAGQWPCS